MHRKHFKLLVDVNLLAASVLAFGTGLVLLVGFHAGEASFRTSALGLARLTWLNLHRLSALLVAAGLVFHVALNCKPFVKRLQHLRHGVSEPLLYVTFWVVTVTGIVLWLLVDGSAPLQGPVPLGPPADSRNHVIDLHHLVGLLALPLAVHHIGHRWRWMTRSLQSLVQRGREATNRLPSG